jgi:hypothetical protein
VTSGREIPLYSVHLTIPRSGGWHDWRTVSGRFEEQLGAHESPTVIGPHIEREVRRRPDYVRVIISVAVDAPDIAQALTAAWWMFRKAAGDDLAGWDLAEASAEVRPADLSGRPSARLHRWRWQGPRRERLARSRVELVFVQRACANASLTISIACLRSAYEARRRLRPTGGRLCAPVRSDSLPGFKDAMP